MSHFWPLEVHSTDFYSKLLATKMLSKTYKVSTDSRPSIISQSLLSPTALVFFREIVREKVRCQRSHHLLGQIYSDQSSQHDHKMRTEKSVG